MRTVKPVVLINKLERLNKKSLSVNGYYCVMDKYEGEPIFIKKIPLYKYKQRPVLFGEIKIRLSSGDVVCEIIDQNGQLYAPFYNPDMHPAHRSFLNKLIRNLNAEIGYLDTRPNKEKNYS